MFTTMHLQAYREAAGWAGQFEFILRAITPAIWADRVGTSKDIKSMFDDIVQELRPHIAAEDLAFLNAINLCDLRHDIIHCRLSKAFAKVGGKNNDPSVAKVIAIDPDENVMAPVERMVRGEGIPIAETRTEIGGLSMWLVQMAASGFFARSARAFAKAYVILDRALGARAESLWDGHGTGAGDGEDKS
jgi:hypothetical protein